MQKGGNGDKIQPMGTSHYLIVHQVALLGVSYHCVKKNQIYAVSPCIYIYILKCYGLCNRHKISFELDPNIE